MNKSDVNFCLSMILLVLVSLGAMILHIDDRVDTLEQQNSELVTMLHEKLADKGEDVCK